MEKTAVAFLTDYRSGTIGRVSLESPNSRADMIAHTTPEQADQTHASDSRSDSALDNDSSTDTPQ
jgi:ribosome biogenesis GTPase A